MWIIAVNPTAGSGKALSIAREVEKYLSSRGEISRTIVAPTAAELTHRLADIAFELGDEIRAIIAVGGDGLAHLALQICAPAHIPFAVVPAGTGNDFARTLGWSDREIDALLDLMISQPPTSIDLGNADSEWFGAILSSGFDSVVNERANQLRWPTGAAQYNVAIALELPRFQAIEYEITIDGSKQSIEAMLIAIGNGRSYGAGMNICPEADIKDGLFDIVILEPVSKVEFIKVFPRVYAGTHINHPRVKTLRAKKVQIKGDAIAYADGERIGPAPVSAECIAGAGLTWIR